MSKKQDLSEDIKKAAKNSDVSSLMGMLSSTDKEVFASLLKDKKARDELLSSPEAKALFEKLLGGR
ncbi:MAG: hypothetical protein IJW27_00520 [Clostridia bacterium]|nr:hypothetical protein [Clostridia bacterium]